MNKRMMIVKIGYHDFAMTPEDALAFIALADRAEPVTQKDWRGPWVREVRDEDRDMISECRMGTVTEPLPDAPFVEPKAPEPLAIGHTPKLMAPAEDLPF
jgi:hypothetical protein